MCTLALVFPDFTFWYWLNDLNIAILPGSLLRNSVCQPLMIIHGDWSVYWCVCWYVFSLFNLLTLIFSDLTITTLSVPLLRNSACQPLDILHCAWSIHGCLHWSVSFQIWTFDPYFGTLTFTTLPLPFLASFVINVTCTFKDWCEYKAIWENTTQ